MKKMKDIKKMGIEVKNVIDHTLKNGGGTFDPSTLEPANLAQGFIVALDGHEKKIQLGGEEEEKLVEEVQKYLNENHEILQAPGVFLGTWVHENMLYLDVVEVIFSIQRAIELGRAREQIGIWDIKSQSEILL